MVARGAGISGSLNIYIYMCVYIYVCVYMCISEYIYEYM